MVYFHKAACRVQGALAVLLFFGFAGGFSSSAIGDPAQAHPAAPELSSAQSVEPNAQLVTATQGLVQALVKSVQQAAMPQGANSPIPPGAVAMMRAADAQDKAKQDTAKSSGDTPSRAPQHWEVPRDAQLQSVLADWCRRAGWTLVWQSDYSYRIEASATFDGDFVVATTAMLTALGHVSPPIYPEIYKGNRVVVIKNDPSR